MHEVISLLLIDDDVKLGNMIQSYLAPHGMDVHVAHDGRGGLATVFTRSFDLVLLDVVIPGMDGFEVLGEIRKNSQIPVIMLTGRSGEEWRIAGLNGGADDYLAKPVAPEELLAHIHAVLRRSGRLRPEGPRAVEVMDIRLEPGSRRVWRGDLQVNLTSSEFEILHILMQAAGRAVSRDELAAALYRREATPFERAMDVHVCHLRKKLENGGSSYIRTVRSVGYLFCAESAR